VVSGDGEGGGSGEEEETTGEAGSIGVTPWDWEGFLVLSSRDGMF
jgi:hypothetical protein